MDEHNGAQPSAEDEDQDEFEVTGREARARWRQVRLQFYLGFAVIFIGLLAAWRLWHRSPEQLTWIAFSLGAGTLALRVWRHDLIGFSYSKASGDEPEETFTAKRPPVRREIAAPVLLIAAGLLFLAGTSTGFGRRLASIFEGLKTLSDARESAWSIAFAPLTVPLFIIILLIMAAFGVALVGIGIAQLFRFAIPGFKRRPGEESGLAEFASGIVLLGILALMAYSVLHNSDYYLDAVLGPLRTVWGWF
jgi:hypothetical protein